MDFSFPKIEIPEGAKESFEKLNRQLSMLSDINVSQLFTPANFLPDDYLNAFHMVTPEDLEMNISSVIPADYYEKSLEYQQKSLDMLTSINKNTANLSSLVELIRENEENQELILRILTEILSIAKAKEKEEAKSIFKKVTTTINSSVENTDSVIKLTGWAMAIYKMVEPLL